MTNEIPRRRMVDVKVMAFLLIISALGTPRLVQITSSGSGAL
jgi:hypothetical protein